MAFMLSDLLRTDEKSEAGALRTSARLIGQLIAELPQAVDAGALSQTSKCPFKAAVLSAALSYRALELGEATTELHTSNKRLAAALTSRALMETAAVVYYVTKRVERAVAEDSLGDTDDILMRGLMGSLAPYSTWKPLQVVTAIDHVAKEVKQYRASYDELCEIAHPNWRGTHNLFAEIDENILRTAFGKGAEPGISWQDVLIPMVVALAVLIYARGRLQDAMPGFVALSEATILKKQGT